MSESNKLSEQELQDLKQITDRYTKLVQELGEIEFEITNSKDKLVHLEREKENLLSDYRILKENSEVLSKTLSEKYGQGRVNLETGYVDPV